MKEVETRHVLITGGSRGLGAHMVQSLLDAGYAVSTCSRKKSEQVEAWEGSHGPQQRFFWAAADIGDEGQTNGFVRAAIEWGKGLRLWGLINNAGIAMAGILATFPNIDSERILRVNLLGALQASRIVCQHLLRGPAGGRILNISSIIGTRGYNGLAAYSASKAGMDGLTRALARELGRRGITVNSIAPGYMPTEMSSTLNAGQLSQIVNRTPLGKLAEPADVSALALFLLSDAAAMITGQTIQVDGGISS